MRKRWIPWPIVVLCMAVLVTASFFYIQQNRYSLTITMDGKSVMAVEHGQTFVDPGARARGFDRFGQTVDIPVSCQGQVDTDTPGVYRLRYRATYQGKICTGYRDVHVVESLAPIITLVSDPSVYTLPNATYEEEGYTAIDWHDGDITHLVQRSEANGVITYSVTNSSGLTATVQRTIRYNDPLWPVLSLSGPAEMTVTAGKTFTDPGFHASDNVDGELTDKVQVTGFVDGHRPGTYRLTYTVSDSWGNTASAVRDVHVQLPSGDTSDSTGKIIYLTFDDGPGKHTERLLDILAKYDVKASFFLVNTGAISIATRIAEEGHTVAIHTATHDFSQVYANDEAFYADLYEMQSIIAEKTGQTTFLMRFPGGSSNSISKKYNKGIMTRLTKSVVENGFRYFDWNVDSNDAGGATTAGEVFSNVIQGVEEHDVSVVLQHDIHEFSVDAVEQIIIWGLANGYTFLPLTDSSPTCEHSVFN